MKKLFIVFLAILSVTPAYADGGRGHGYGHGYYGRGYGWGWSGDWIFPALVGGALVYGLTQPPTVVQPQTVYLQPQPSVAPQSTQYWYFCAAANAYYPYVAACPGGWQAVPATPPAASASMPPGAPAQ
jgi:hypothetical protein